MGTSISRFASTKFNGNVESSMSLVLSKMEEGEGSRKAPAKRKSSMHSIKFILCLLPLLAVPILLRTETSPFDSSSSSGTVPDGCQGPNQSEIIDIQTARLRNSVTFLPLKDLRFAETAMTGNTWFMSSLNDTHEKDEAEYLYFPSQASKGRLLCLKGDNIRDGTKNSYALAWEDSLPESAIYKKGLTFVCDSYYDYINLWHGISATAPFAGWSMKNGCLRPTRWVLFHWGEFRDRMGSWLHTLLEANFGKVPVEESMKGDHPYCFERAVVMRHNLGSMGKEKQRKVFDLLRCKAREFCGINPAGRGREVDEKGDPIIRLTLLMRRGSRSFKNATTVINIFAKECARVKGCLLKVAQSEDLSFCDQVRVLTYADIVASPHGAQLTNLMFMDRDSSIMEFFPKGWLELAGVGQYVFRWMADSSGMKHRGAWWDRHSEKQCPFPPKDSRCFRFYKDDKVGHNSTFFAEWTRTVLNQVRTSKSKQAPKSAPLESSACAC